MKTMQELLKNKVILFLGLPCSGKSTLSKAVAVEAGLAYNGCSKLLVSTDEIWKKVLDNPEYFPCVKEDRLNKNIEWLAENCKFDGVEQFAALVALRHIDEYLERRDDPEKRLDMPLLLDVGGLIFANTDFANYLYTNQQKIDYVFELKSSPDESYRRVSENIEKSKTMSKIPMVQYKVSEQFTENLNKKWEKNWYTLRYDGNIHRTLADLYDILR